MHNNGLRQASPRKKWHEYGLYVIKHSDGNLYPIINLLIDAGIDCLHPIDPLAGMDLEKVKNNYGKIESFIFHENYHTLETSFLLQPIPSTNLSNTSCV